MRTLAIGDIHGHLGVLDALLSAVAPGADDTLVFLGDYVDRGPDSRGVLARVRSLVASGRAVALRGNHEVMFRESRHNADYRSSWLRFGGRETLASYGGSFARVPEADTDFVTECRPYFETDTHVFVHAGLEPWLPLDQQPDHALYWEKLSDFQLPHQSGKRIVCGHTEQRDGVPLVWPHVVCIDTWAYHPSGWLTCLDAASGRYWQANQRGQTREGAVGSCAFLSPRPRLCGGEG